MSPDPGAANGGAHRAASRGGAPKGNRNAVTHGMYVGGRKGGRQKEKEERERLSPIRRLERVLLRLAKGGTHRYAETARTAPECWNAERERAALLKLLALYEKPLRAETPIQPEASSEIFACYYLLKMLCVERPCFVSRSALLDEICELFAKIDDPEWRGTLRGILSMTYFYRGWRELCATLYDCYCPPVPKKPKKGSPEAVLESLIAAASPRQKPRKNATKAESAGEHQGEQPQAKHLADQPEGKNRAEQRQGKHQEPASVNSVQALVERMNSLQALVERLKTDPDLAKLPFSERANQICRLVCEELECYMRSSGISSDAKDLARLTIQTIKADTAKALRESM